MEVEATRRLDPPGTSCRGLSLHASDTFARTLTSVRLSLPWARSAHNVAHTCAVLSSRRRAYMYSRSVKNSRLISPYKLYLPLGCLIDMHTVTK